MTASPTDIQPSLPNQSLDDKQALCVSCGMCCSGILVSHAGLEPDEFGRATRYGLTLVDDEKSFRLPCQRYEGKCTIYADRFEICRSYECAVLKKVAKRETSLEEARELVRCAKELVAQIDELMTSRQDTWSVPVAAGSYVRLSRYLRSQEQQLGKAECFRSNGALIAKLARLKAILGQFEPRYY